MCLTVWSLQKGNHIRLILQGTVWSKDSDPEALHVHIQYTPGTDKNTQTAECWHTKKDVQSYDNEVFHNTMFMIFIFILSAGNIPFLRWTTFNEYLEKE